jgi:hypothetical protein
MPHFKIGVSNNPNRRRREIERTIQAQHGIDKFVKVLWTKEIENAYDVELQTHFYLNLIKIFFIKRMALLNGLTHHSKKFIQLLARLCVGIS